MLDELHTSMVPGIIMITRFFFIITCFLSTKAVHCSWVRTFNTRVNVCYCVQKVPI